jgi:hypothetical protein
MRHLENTPKAAEAAAFIEGPTVAAIIEVDLEYRRRAAAGRLKTSAPRRFNQEKNPGYRYFILKKRGGILPHFFQILSERTS